MYSSVCAAAGDCVRHVMQMSLHGMTKVELMPMCSRFAIRSFQKLFRSTSLLSLPPAIHFTLSWLLSTLPLKAVDLKTPPGAVYRGPPKDGVKPGCTLTISDEDFILISSGKLTAQKVCKFCVGWVVQPGVPQAGCYQNSSAL